MGCKLALDDFGTGYSSLTHLHSLPFDEIKVEGRFVGSMAERRDSRKIVAAVVGLSQSLGLTTVAEGVETLEQVQMLQWLGCELAQGWFYGKALPAAELADTVANFQRKPSSAMSIDVVGRVSRGSFDVLPSVRLAQLQAVYDGAPVGLAFLDRDLRYKMMNRKLAQMNGRPMEEHIGRTVSQMIPEIFPMVEGYIRRALNGEAIAGVEVTKPASGANAGQTILLSYEPARDEAGEVVGVSVAIVDLSPTRRAEAARREAEEHFRYMIELLPQIPWIIDPQGRALDVSQRWLDITGMKGDEWRGFGWLDALHPDDLQPTRDAMSKSFAKRSPDRPGVSRPSFAGRPLAAAAFQGGQLVWERTAKLSAGMAAWRTLPTDPPMPGQSQPPATTTCATTPATRPNCPTPCGIPCSRWAARSAGSSSAGTSATRRA